MAKNTPALRLTFTATQGSGDAFVEATIPTGLVSVGSGAKTAIRIIEVGVEFPGVAEVDSTYEASLTRVSQPSMPNLTERSLLVKFKRQVALTTSGQIYVPDLVTLWQPPEAANVIVVEANIFFQLDTSGTTGTNTATGYLLGEYVNVTETERLQLVAQSLES